MRLGAREWNALFDDGEVLRGRLAVAAGCEFVLDLLAFVKIGQSGAFDGRYVNESVLAAVVWLDESESLGWIEPFDGSNSHVDSLFKAIAAELGPSTGSAVEMVSQ